MAKQDNRHHCYLSTILSVRTGEGNINSAKCVDIFDNNRLPVALKFENYQWIFQDDSAPGTPVRTDKILERYQ
jgi:hypothetical protein